MGDNMDEDEMIVEPGDAAAIRSAPVQGNESFLVNTTMLHLLNTKGLFGGLPTDDPNRHLKNFLGVCTTNVHPNVSVETVRLRLFPFSLTGEATVWFDDLPAGSITTWVELNEAFLKKFFPPSRMLQLRDEINNFRQLPTEALHEAWTHFKKKVKSCPKHGLPDSVLLQTFYRSLDTVNKSVANNIAGGSVMENSYAVMSALLDKLTETTRETEVDGGGPSKIVLSREIIKKEEERDETMAKLVTQMDLLTKHVLGGGSKRVNVVGSCEGDSMDEQCFQVCEEKDNFINNQAGVPIQTTKVLIKDLGGKVNGIKVGTRIAEIKGGAKILGILIGGTTIKGVITTIKVESTDSFYKETRDEMKSLGQIIGFHSTTIKQLESQLGQISATLNQRKKGTLPSDTVANPWNDNDHKCHEITTRSGKTIRGEALVKDDMVVDDEKMVEEPIVVEEEVTPKKKWASIAKPIIVEDGPKIDNALKGEEAVDEVQRDLPLVPNPPPPFPQRLAKKAGDEKFLKFIERLKGISFNIPLVEILEQMPGYAKFMKDIVTKRRHASFEIVGVTHHCSSIVMKALVQKKEDLGAFTIPFTIGMYKFAIALCDLGASMNLMWHSIFNKLGLGTRRPTTMRLLMADRTVKKPVGILYDVLVRVDRFIFSADFVILDCEVDFEVPIILGRPFLATRRALVDVERGDLKFRMNDKEVTFHICKSMKQSADMSVVSVIDTIDEAMDTTVEHEHMGDMLAAVIMNYEGEDEEEFKETVNALIGLGSYHYNPKKLDLDLENRATPPAKPSIIEPPTLELKPLPSHLRYKKAIGWCIADIQGIPPGICTHKIQLDEECEPSVEHQRRLNPPMQEVVKIEIIKWLDAGVVYPISDSSWVSPVQCVPKKGGITVVANAKNELIPTRTVTGWRVCMDYQKLNKWINGIHGSNV
ncbi:uncharacterized protein LOC132061921 [Lycium ferocissimum]|uniref:uncharacterized protein LOC132061921 n=1 Tax=Lycium ferocissimum TaxID=112874 RepID=UPI00281533EF|nr:uncharacterized protein LOC132061921 [Lycium ferocissimum]